MQLAGATRRSNEVRLNPFCAYMLPYLVRYREKGGIDDLEKALHVLEKWIEEEKRIAASRASARKRGKKA